jgi:hypothetical protein
MTADQRIEQLEAELKELKAEVTVHKAALNAVTLVGGFLVSQGYQIGSWRLPLEARAALETWQEHVLANRAPVAPGERRIDPPITSSNSR